MQKHELDYVLVSVNPRPSKKRMLTKKRLDVKIDELQALLRGLVGKEHVRRESMNVFRVNADSEKVKQVMRFVLSSIEHHVKRDNYPYLMNSTIPLEDLDSERCTAPEKSVGMTA